jgi:hypothetical protein
MHRVWTLGRLGCMKREHRLLRIRKAPEVGPVISLEQRDYSFARVAKAQKKVVTPLFSHVFF